MKGWQQARCNLSAACSRQVTCNTLYFFVPVYSQTTAGQPTTVRGVCLLVAHRCVCCAVAAGCRWVTAVCYLPDGRVMSGGMDSDIWLWPAAATRGSKVRTAQHASCDEQGGCRWMCHLSAIAPMLYTTPLSQVGLAHGLRACHAGTCSHHASHSGDEVHVVTDLPCCAAVGHWPRGTCICGGCAWR
jgi:hypothetical protein